MTPSEQAELQQKMADTIQQAVAGVLRRMIGKPASVHNRKAIEQLATQKIRELAADAGVDAPPVAVFTVYARPDLLMIHTPMHQEPEVHRRLIYLGRLEEADLYCDADGEVFFSWSERGAHSLTDEERDEAMRRLEQVLDG